MCGLVVAAGNLFNKDIVNFHNLVRVGTLRGSDSTGVAAINTHSVDIIKDTVSGWYFRDANYKELQKKVGVTNIALFGHNRAATTGGIKTEAAHPFRHGNIVGMHNGHIPGNSLLDLPEQTKFLTDSEQIIYNISKVGVDAALEYVRGAFALIWWDTAKRTLNFIRNKDRPLYYARSKNGKVIYLASEFKMLDWILTRDPSDTTEYDYFTVPVDTLFTIEISNKGVGNMTKRAVVSGKHRLYAPVKKDPPKQLPLLELPKQLPTNQNVGPVSPVKPAEKRTTAGSGTLGLLLKWPSIEGVPTMTPQEIRDMSLTSLKDYLANINKGRLDLERRISNVTLLSNMNWSDRVTWRKNAKETSQRVINNITTYHHQDNILYQIKCGVEAQIAVKTAVAAGPEIKALYEKSVTIVNPPPNTDLREWKTLANHFQSTAMMDKFFDKHSCAVCSENDPLNFYVANSIILKNDEGFICSECSKHESTHELIEMKAERA